MIQAVHQCLDAFELRVFVRPTPTIYLTILQADMVSKRADVDVILDMRLPNPKTELAELAEDTMLAALFTTSTALSPPPWEHAKRHRSKDNKEARAMKKDHTGMEAVRRASLVDEEALQMRNHEIDVGASSSMLDNLERSTIEGADIVVDTTEGVPTSDGTDS